MKTDIEYELLSIRQNLRDSLRYILSQDVVNLNLYRKVYTRWYTCNKMLYHYKTTYKKAI